MTGERKYNCKLTDNNRCKWCPRADNSGHFMMCSGSPYRVVCSTIIDLYTRTQPTIKLESIINSEVKTDADEFYCIAWILASTADHLYNDTSMTYNARIESILARLLNDKNSIDALASTNKKFRKLSYNLSRLLSLYNV